MSLFDEQERKQPDDFILQFEALTKPRAEDKKAVRAMIGGMLIRHQAKELMDHAQ